jgi:hypothetical protein
MIKHFVTNDATIAARIDVNVFNVSDPSIVSNFNVGTKTNLISDHIPIHISLHTRPTIPLPNASPHEKWRVDEPNLDWKNFKNTRSIQIDDWYEKWKQIHHQCKSTTNTLSFENINEGWIELRDAIITTAHLTNGKKIISERSKFWYNITNSSNSASKV